MKIEFIPTPEFAKAVKHLKKKYRSISNDLKEFEAEFEKNPEVGDDLGNGFRKIRIKITSKGCGKSGGGRVITYEMYVRTIDNEDVKGILLVDIYDKSEQESITENRYISLVKDFLKDNENGFFDDESKQEAPQA